MSDYNTWYTAMQKKNDKMPSMVFVLFAPPTLVWQPLTPSPVNSNNLVVEYFDNAVNTLCVICASYQSGQYYLLEAIGKPILNVPIGNITRWAYL